MLKLISFIIALSLGTSLPASSVTAPAPNTKITLQIKEGSLKISEILSSCSEIAKSTPSKFVRQSIVGKILDINGKKYEIRYFSFEDTRGILPIETNFLDYIEKNNLSSMPSTSMTPLPGISFESFDFRKVNIEDGVYFSMALRLVE